MKITYSPEFPELLYNCNITLAVSTYQAGKLVFVSSRDSKFITQFGKNIKRPMGIAYKDGYLVTACKDTVEIHGLHTRMAKGFPQKPNFFDAMFFPRATYYTGMVDLHDIVWCDEGIVAVNTAFSCLVKISAKASFEILWKPSFISEMVPEDRCHLNGLAERNGQLEYVSLLSKSDERHGWRETKLESGLIMNIADESVLVDQLPMPHSPRFINGKLFYLLAATGEIYYHDFETKKDVLFNKIDGFARGMCYYEDYLFVGMSKIRASSKSFQNLPISKLATRAGVYVYSLSTGSKVAELFYEEKIEEMFELAIIPNVMHGLILDKAGETSGRAVIIDEDNYFWKKEKKS